MGRPGPSAGDQRLGRAAPQALLDAADTVSEIADVKHAYRAGIKAQAGVDL